MLSNRNASDLKIAISGKSGCGNTTVSRMVADALKLRFINFTFRNLASERGLDLVEVINLASTDDSWDREVDNRQVSMAREGGGCVLGSRLAIWMLPEADLKVYLTASQKNRVLRIQKREKDKDLSEIEEFTALRDKLDHARYLHIYKIDNDNFTFADLVIDTDVLRPEAITELIFSELKKKFPSIQL